MPLSADDRTRLEYVECFTEYQWDYQITVYYKDYAESLLAHRHFGKVKGIIRSKYRGQPFLCRLALHSRYQCELDRRADTASQRVKMAYYTFYTYGVGIDIEWLQLRIEEVLGINIWIKQWKALDHGMGKAAQTIYSYEPHDLKWFFQLGSNPIRYSKLNWKKAVERDMAIDIDRTKTPKKRRSRAKKPRPDPV